MPDYIRVPAVRSHPQLIDGLARLVLAALASPRPVNCANGRICPGARICGQDLVLPIEACWGAGVLRNYPAMIWGP